MTYADYSNAKLLSEIDSAEKRHAEADARYRGLRLSADDERRILWAGLLRSMRAELAQREALTA